CDINETIYTDLSAPISSLPPESHNISQDNNVYDYFLSDKSYQIYTNINHTDIIVPNTYKQAMLSKDRDKWIEAMSKEIRSLSEKRTWDLVKTPPNTDIIGSRWVFSVKVNPSHNITFK
ncbi:unnamed protein product, partial [Meganyctiphanes norvegica]